MKSLLSSRVRASLTPFIVLVAVATACGSDGERSAIPTTSTVAASEATTTVTTLSTSSAAPDTTEQTSVDATPVARDELSDFALAVLTDIETAFGDSPDVWAGFSPANHPMVVGLTDGAGNIEGAFTLHHPVPEALGVPVPVDGVASALESLTYIDQPSGISIPGNGIFEWGIDIGGVATYVVMSFEADGPPIDSPIDIRSVLPAGSVGWQGLALHEMFHQHQGAFWTERFVDQSAYDYELLNFELALLEDAALVAAYEASDAEAETAIGHFIALRATRLELFATTELDEQQEHSEGTAQWFALRSTNIDDKPFEDPVLGSLADPAGFLANQTAGPPLQRFYLTGATVMELLDRAGVDWLGSIEAGGRPAEILRSTYEIDPADFEALIAEARVAYDPGGLFANLAQGWVDASSAEAPANTDPPDIQIDSELADCLAQFGIDAAELAGEIEIPDEAVACFE